MRVGDRIEVDGHRGDVIDIQFLRTTMLELNNWLDIDEPTGRVIVIPNSFIFKDKVINYCHVHPYVWNKIDITVTFETPACGSRGAALAQFSRRRRKDEMRAAEHAAVTMEDTYGVPDTIYEPKLSSIIADSGVLYRMVFVSHYRRVVGTRNRINNRIIKEFERPAAHQLRLPDRTPHPHRRGGRVRGEDAKALDR